MYYMGEMKQQPQQAETRKMMNPHISVLSIFFPMLIHRKTLYVDTLLCSNIIHYYLFNYRMKIIYQ